MQMSLIKDAQACYAWPASTLHPWKLAAHVMRENLKKGANLQTRTRVDRIVRCSGDTDKWTVKSERGDIDCWQVVHATNAYSSALEPSLRGLIYPTPHMCNQVWPPEAFKESQLLKNSYGVLLPEHGLFSINPRSTTSGPVLFGGSNPGQNKLESWVKEHPKRGTDDSITGFESVTTAVKEFAESQLTGWSVDAAARSQVYAHSWSGIIALVSSSMRNYCHNSKDNLELERRWCSFCWATTRAAGPVDMCWPPWTVSFKATPQNIRICSNPCFPVRKWNGTHLHSRTWFSSAYGWVFLGKNQVARCLPNHRLQVNEVERKAWYCQNFTFSSLNKPRERESAKQEQVKALVGWVNCSLLKQYW